MPGQEANAIIKGKLFDLLYNNGECTHYNGLNEAILIHIHKIHFMIK